MLEKIRHDKRALGGLILVVLLPLIIGGVYLVQQYASRAALVAEISDIETTRDTPTSASIKFISSVAIKTTVDCSIGLEGVKFRCAQDDEETTVHNFDTRDFDVILENDVGYTIYINSGQDNPTLGFIPAGSDGHVFEFGFEAFTDELIGLSRDDEGYDPSKDINNDGFINLHDAAEFIDESH